MCLECHQWRRAALRGRYRVRVIFRAPPQASVFCAEAYGGSLAANGRGLPDPLLSYLSTNATVGSIG